MSAAITPTTRDALAARIAGSALERDGRVRLVVDGPPPTDPLGLAELAADVLRGAGRPPLVVDAGDWLRPASVRLEHGRTDPDMYLDGWLDEGALRRELLDPADPAGSGRVLRRFHDAARDRAFRDGYLELTDGAVVLVAGTLLLGRGLPFDVAVHLRMSAAALRRRLPEDLAWTAAAHERYETEWYPGEAADLVVLSDHPERPAIRG
ncbi:MAG: uridine kinase [Pseudonocardia sp.]|uniref:uridine kinase n=1 Tax=unclassified Pseudonocardia TaxID=2619320 RepID=UPI0008691A06|nr:MULTISPECIES: uridine kinase [unclassified Pseudonocardia]MBN9109832.1 uridine kinase [Pseudonocardia sp.]ODU03322.1 MAG: uridine kinase [Pseudonocardia sp. SCN 72-51]ODV03216.1 MAG: uridine kinase [Pseudonocardia sp. SCN 73-27]